MKQFVKWGRAVCYSGYREGQSPDGKSYPGEGQILEDLEIICREGFSYIRMYDANEYLERVCRVIRDNGLPLSVMAGTGLINEVNNTGCAWNRTVYSEEELLVRRNYNESMVDNLCRIANLYPEVIRWVSVGNENTPEWGENTVPEERLIIYAETLRSKTGKPVTFNEGAREWPKLEKLASHLDFISIHSYPLWYGLSESEALKANIDDYEKVRSCYGDKEIIFSEAGWTTSCLENTQMQFSEACEERQAEYYREFLKWTDGEKITAFVFEAFDEPWKGGADSREAEKHWGLFDVERKPKLVVKALNPSEK